MTDFESLKNNYQAEKSFIVHQQVKKSVTKNTNMFYRSRTNLK